MLDIPVKLTVVGCADLLINSKEAPTSTFLTAITSTEGRSLFVCITVPVKYFIPQENTVAAGRKQFFESVRVNAMDALEESFE